MGPGKSGALHIEVPDFKCFISIRDQRVLEVEDERRVFKLLVLQNNTGNELKSGGSIL